MKREAGLDAYLKEAVSWDADRIRRIHASETRAWWVAGASLLVTLALAASLWALMPLKRVEPFVIRVDNATGVVDVVPAYDGQAEPNEAVHRYFLGHYVRLHERFNAAAPSRTTTNWPRSTRRR